MIHKAIFTLSIVGIRLYPAKAENQIQEKNHRHRSHYIDQICDGMGDEAFYLFDVLVHRFLNGSRGSVVQIP